MHQCINIEVIEELSERNKREVRAPLLGAYLGCDGHPSYLHTETREKILPRFSTHRRII